jgi:hypothetical protein
MFIYLSITLTKASEAFICSLIIKSITSTFKALSSNNIICASKKPWSIFSVFKPRNCFIDKLIAFSICLIEASTPIKLKSGNEWLFALNALENATPSQIGVAFSFIVWLIMLHLTFRHRYLNLLK